MSRVNAKVNPRVNADSKKTASFAVRNRGIPRGFSDRFDEVPTQLLFIRA